MSKNKVSFAEDTKQDIADGVISIKEAKELDECPSPQIREAKLRFKKISRAHEEAKESMFMMQKQIMIENSPTINKKEKLN